MNLGLMMKKAHGGLFIESDKDAIIILEVFNKKSQQTPKKVIDNCKKRIKEYDNE